MWGYEMACDLLGPLLQGEPHVPPLCAGLAVHRITLVFHQFIANKCVGALHLPELPGIQPYPA